MKTKDQEIAELKAELAEKSKNFKELASLAIEMAEMLADGRPKFTENIKQLKAHIAAL